MRRSEADKYIKRVTPIIFDRQCAKCGDYIKREPLWRYLSFNFDYTDFDLYDFDLIYLCEKCFPTKQDAYEYLKEMNYI